MGDTSLAYDLLEFGETMTNLTQNLLGKHIACLPLPPNVLFFFSCNCFQMYSSV